MVSENRRNIWGNIQEFLVHLILGRNVQIQFIDEQGNTGRLAANAWESTENELRIGDSTHTDAIAFYGNLGSAGAIIGTRGNGDFIIHGDKDGNVGKGTVIRAYANSAWKDVIEVNNEASGTGKLGFYGAAPVSKQTGVAVSAQALHDALVALGLIAV